MNIVLARTSQVSPSYKAGYSYSPRPVPTNPSPQKRAIIKNEHDIPNGNGQTVIDIIPETVKTKHPSIGEEA
jgi:hypothetical protein